jgi:ribokinase
VDCLELRAEVATTVCLCLVGDDGESSIVWHIEDDVAVMPETVRAASSALQRADAVLITFELPVSVIRQLIFAAHSCGARVIVQPAPLLADPAGAASLPWDQVDILVPNEAETRALLSRSQVDRDLPADGLAGALATELCVDTTVVTLGESGCVIHSAGVTRRYPALPAEAVDTTGASDAFTAAVTAKITAGVPEDDAI